MPRAAIDMMRTTRAAAPRRPCARRARARWFRARGLSLRLTARAAAICTRSSVDVRISSSIAAYAGRLRRGRAPPWPPSAPSGSGSCARHAAEHADRRVVGVPRDDSLQRLARHRGRALVAEREHVVEDRPRALGVCARARSAPGSSRCAPRGRRRGAPGSRRGARARSRRCRRGARRGAPRRQRRERARAPRREPGAPRVRPRGAQREDPGAERARADGPRGRARSILNNVLDAPRRVLGSRCGARRCSSSPGTPTTASIAHARPRRAHRPGLRDADGRRRGARAASRPTPPTPPIEELMRTSTDERVQIAAARAMARSESPRAQTTVRALVERRDVAERLRVVDHHRRWPRAARRRPPTTGGRSTARWRATSCAARS